MKKNLKLIIFNLAFLLALPQTSKSIDSLQYSISLNYYKDFSDTYGGGYLYNGEIGITHLWYGACISFGHFQSHTIFIYSITIEDINKKIDINFDETTLMKIGTFSFKITPIQNKYLNTNLLLGIAVGDAKNSRFNSVDYSYSLTNDNFNYLYKDYKLIRKTHFGYQIGIDISITVTKKIGIQFNSRIQDLSNSGDFFFIGGGLCFKL